MSWNSQRQPQRGILRSALKKTSRPQSYFRVPKNLIKRKEVPVEEEELLVFGYGCKIFPPDSHSRDIAQQRHLIPWNGDENLQLMIDRYDGRASLHNLSEFDGDSWNIHYDQSEEESRIEQLCDQERYMAMYTDLAEEKLRHEEELKRLHASIAGEDPTNFSEVGFNYDVSQPEVQTSVVPPHAGGVNNQVQNDAEDEIEEEPFMAPSALAVPSDMEIPPTEKMHAIIEKTASFVSKQGAQMEIVLKAKQANSSQFLFLQFDHYLNPYYKNMIQRLKEGKYRVGMKDGEEETKKEQEMEEESDSDSDGGGYLHPSLFAKSSAAKKQEDEENKEKFKAIHKVDPNHPLAKLIEKGRKANALKQYNMMKTAVQSFNPGSENELEPPPLPSFLEDNNNLQPKKSVASPLPVKEHDALPPKMTPQEAAMVIVPPPPDIQPMVDSVARQIAEEGDSVEDRLRSQNDPMMAFLLPSHELHPYYTFRKTFIREQLKAQQRLQQNAEEQKKAADEEAANAEYQQGKSAPISFSIKGKKESSPKSSILPNRLQILGPEDDETEEEIANNAEGGNMSENKENGSEFVGTIDDSEEGESMNKRKFVEDDETNNSTVKETTSVPLKKPRRKFTLTPQPVAFPSNFTVVTPTGETVSIHEFREKQAERRHKASLLLQKKNEEAVAVSANQPTEKKSSEDIFDIFENNEESSEPDVGVAKVPSVTTSDILKPSIEREIRKSKSGSPPIIVKSNSPDIEKKSSSALPPTSKALTLKDLIAAASRSSTPSSTTNTTDKKRNHSRSRSRHKSRSRSRHRSRSKSRQSSPRDYSRSKRRTRSRSWDRDSLPSSYRKKFGASRDREPRYHHSSGSRRENDENVPSAYKIENPQPASCSNGNYYRNRRRDVSPLYQRSNKRYRQDEENHKKKSRDDKSPHKSKKKSSKSKKKHKKKKSKNKKKKDKDTSTSEEGEWSSQDENNTNDEKKINDTENKGEKLKSLEDKEDGEISPQLDGELSKEQTTS